MILSKIPYLLSYPFYIPHIVAYACSKNKILINEDIYEMSARPYRKLVHEVFSLVYFLHLSSYYRSLFYKRIGRVSILFRWYTPGNKMFFIETDNIGGRCFVLNHPYATILFAKRIGTNFTCRNCTTVGNKQDGLNDQIPTILDNVTIGANVCVIGNITIGNNVVIGAGSVVTKSVPDNCIVVGNPAYIIAQNGKKTK